MLNKVVEPAHLCHTSEGLSSGEPPLGVQIQTMSVVHGSELKAETVHMSDIPTHSSSQRARHLRRVVAKVTQHHNRMIKTMKKTFVHRSEVENLCEKITDTINNEVPPLDVEGTRKVVKANLRR
ncbi:hypothetical protein Tco_1424424 [Tanacetum coccineum]